MIRTVLLQKMKSIAMALPALLLPLPSGAQCLNAPSGQWPNSTVTIVCTGSPQDITTNGYAGEFSLITVNNGVSYTFASSIATDYITISTDGGLTAAAFGTTPLVWTSTVSGNIRFYTHVDNNCGTSNTNRTRSVTCATPACQPPTAVTTNSITDVNAVVSWSGTGTFLLEYGPAGFTPGTGAAAGAGAVLINPAVSPQTIGGLSPGTAYDVYVRADCSAANNGYSSNAGASFITNSGPPPANNDCAGSIGLPANPDTFCNTVMAGNTINATMSAQVPPCNSTAIADVWYSFVAGNSVQKVSLTHPLPSNGAAAYFGYGMAVYSGNCAGPLSGVGCNTGFYDASAPDSVELLLTGLVQGQPYYVQVFRYGPGYDTSINTLSTDFSFDLCVAKVNVPVNDLCSGAISIDSLAYNSLNNYELSGDNTYATDEDLATLPACGSTSTTSSNKKGLWYKLTPSASGPITVSTCNTTDTFDTYLRIYEGSCGAFTSCAGANDDGCNPLSTASFNTVAGTTYYILVTGYSNTSAGNFKITGNGVPLPVAMGALMGERSGSRVELLWQTYAERNNKGFAVQRSMDGRTFQTVGYVGSNAYAGNSASKTDYAYTDRQVPGNGVVYYRLEQKDMDGRTAYSNILQLAAYGADVSELAISATPNPVTHMLKISVAGAGSAEARILLMDITGRQIGIYELKGTGLDIDMAGLVPGVYLVQYRDGINRRTVKISKQ
jgi:hypothetical protein